MCRGAGSVTHMSWLPSGWSVGGLGERGGCAGASLEAGVEVALDGQGVEAVPMRVELGVALRFDRVEPREPLQGRAGRVVALSELGAVAGLADQLLARPHQVQGPAG